MELTNQLAKEIGVSGNHLENVTEDNYSNLKVGKEAYEVQKESKEKQDFEYNPQRQSYCYVYYIKKLVDN